MKTLLFILSLLFIFFPIKKVNKTKNEILHEQVNKVSENQHFVIDIDKNYPRKEINIYEIADIEYLPLETKPDFFTNGLISYLDNDLLVFTESRSGDVLFFNREGVALRKFNHKGSGPNEYPTNSATVVYDKSRNEIYINSYSIRKIFVYGIDGTFHRSLPYFNNKLNFSYIISTDKYLLCCDHFLFNKGNTFYLVSKTDGKLVSEIPYYIVQKVYNYKKTLISLGNNMGTNQYTTLFDYLPMYETDFGVMLSEISNDTIFLLNKEHKKIAKVVREPGINSINGQNKVLVSEFITNKYHFLSSYKLESGKDNKYRHKYLMIDLKSGEISEPSFYNDRDYTTKKEAHIGGQLFPGMMVSPRLPLLLIEANKKGELKGNLKEITERLGENDNPFLRITKFK